ncbi:MAG: ubiquinone/menaquinone biosynthesis methyltransferase [Candidatus Omnitrophota bacterium]|nr:ubiquinone/menaquinone biosynthesis methyltransferase [Candidatus Omnitrophota bacterium]
MQNGVREIFSEVPKTYDAVNAISTFGLDIAWRKKLAKLAAGFGGERFLDLCTGTAKTAIYLKQATKNKTEICAADFSLPMLKIALTKPQAKSIEFIACDVKKLPFPDNSFDVATISFATRNININREILISTFKEFRRVLKPGGCFLNLETSQPSFWIIKKLFHLYVKLFVRPIGTLISGSKKAYTYLSKTIPRFYSAQELKTLLEQAGFKEVNFQKLPLGIAAIHIGKKT